MKKRVGFGVVLLLLLIVLLRFSNKELIDICVVGDFSQSSTFSSVEVFRAVELAVEELNSVEAKYELSRLNASSYESNDALRRAIITGKYDMILGPETSSL